jgi:hypothetical protein
MADFGLTVTITDADTHQPIAGATASGTDCCGLDAADNPVPALSDDKGIATIKALYLTVTAPGYEDYAHQLYRRPALGASVPVSLRRRA